MDVPIKIIYTKQEEKEKDKGQLPKIKYAMRTGGDSKECLLFSQEGLTGFLAEILKKYGKEAVLQLGEVQITAAKDESWPSEITKESTIEEPDFPNGIRRMSVIDVMTLIADSLKNDSDN